VEITGGVFYTCGEFDTEFIDAMTHACFQAISQKGELSLEEISSFIQKSGISKVHLQSSDVKTLVRTLILDGKLETVSQQDIPTQVGMKRHRVCLTILFF